MYELIPQDHLDALCLAVTETFGNKLPAAITAISGGSLYHIYKIRLKDQVIIVRLMDLQEALTNRQNQIQCLQIAANMGIWIL